MTENATNRNTFGLVQPHQGVNIFQLGDARLSRKCDELGRDCSMAAK